MAPHPRPILPKREGDFGPSAWTPSNTASSGSKKKRIVAVEAACKACRARRTKCDGKRPTCQACEARVIVCEYEFAAGQTRHGAQKQRVDRAEAANAILLEILWYLKTQPVEETRIFIDYIKSDDPVDGPSMLKWIKARQRVDGDATFQLSDLRALFTPASQQPTDSERMSEVSAWSEKGQETVNSPAAGSFAAIVMSQTQDSKHAATVGTIGVALDMFFQCAGALCYVFNKEQAGSTYHEALGNVPHPTETPFSDVLLSPISIQRGAQLAELCGMAAVGLLYSRASNLEHPPLAILAAFLYSSSRGMLDSSIESNPLGAMKLCALLAEYNIVLKSTVGLAYVELGLALGRLHGIPWEGCPAAMDIEDFRGYTRVWRTLALSSTWLSASLGYILPSTTLPLEILKPEDSKRLDDMLHGELVKVTIIKANIIRDIPADRAVDDSTINRLRGELKVFYEELPVWMSMNKLARPQGGDEDPMRRMVFYLHLFYLSAMQLLHRRVIANLTDFIYSVDDITQEANAAVKEGLMAAKMTARVLALMRQDGSVVQLCWMCTFTSFMTSIVILHAAIQKVFNGHPASLWIADLTLVAICDETLEYCAEIDTIAARFQDIISKYLQVIKDAVDGEMNQDVAKDIDEHQSMIYLFDMKSGDTDLHKAARDLAYLVRRPFGNALELPAGNVGSRPALQSTLVNWMEAAIGATMEWQWELEASGLQSKDGKAPAVMESPSPGHDVPPAESAWT